MLVVGAAAFAGLYVAYAILLGGVNGLPQLPDKFLTRANSQFVEIRAADRSPVDVLLERAFGPKCPELENPAYSTKLELRDRGLVFAAGPLPEIREPTKKIRISPLSLAVFQKPSPNAGPDEAPEIVTLHADEAILEYDKAIRSRTEILQQQAKLVGVELIANPEAPYRDLRKGRIIITTNQKSDDPGRWLIVRTPGPVYYQTADQGKPLPPDVPAVRTSAAVEIENRANIPKPLWGQRLFAVPGRGDELHAGTAIADMLFGLRAPPPTATAIGLRMYFAPEPAKPGKPGEKPGVSGPNRLQRLEFGEQVQFHIWLDRSSGFPGSGGDSTAKAPRGEPPLALAAVAGGTVGGVAVSQTLAEAAMLTIETLGPFRYDLANQTARFEAAATAPVNQSNNVEVVRSSANGLRDSLFCKVLDIGFEPQKEKGKAAPAPGNQGGIKSLHATGPYVQLESQTEQLNALGTELIYLADRATGTTTMTFRGTPIDAVQKKSRLKTAAGLPAELVVVTKPGPLDAAKKPTKLTEIAIKGPGQIAMTDGTPGAGTITATWATQFTQGKEFFAGQLLDKLTFDGGRFEDANAGMTLTGDVIRLWLANAGKPGEANQSVPYALQAVKNVTSNSPDFVIDETDALTVWFKAGEPIAVKPAAPAMPADKPLSPVATPGPPAVAAKAPPPKKPPMHLTARTIEAWVRRSPKGVPAKPGESPPMAYDLERAVCVDRVDARQAPADPAKSPRGLDLRCAKLILDQHRIKDFAGFSAELTAAPGELAEFHYEATSLAGPLIHLDQLANFVRVTGAGALRMPAGSGFMGSAVAKPGEAGVKPVAANVGKGSAELNVEWHERMEFRGADGLAIFTGKVQAKQESAPPPGTEANADAVWGQAFVLCHRMDIRFDKPVYFNQLKPDDGKKGDNPQVAQAVCRAAPDDDADANRAASFVLFEDEQRKRDRGVVKRQRVRAASLDFRGDKTKTLIAPGPGEFRILQPGAVDARPGAAAANPVAREMKLTVVTYRHRAQLDDRGDTFQEGLFEGDAKAIQVPATDFERALDMNSNLPERSSAISAEESLIVSTYKPAAGPPEQKLDATGNARIITDDFRGRANRITSDGKLAVLDGSGGRPAFVEQTGRGSTGQSAIPAKRIEYDLVNNRIKIVDGSHGRISPK
jgi:hypothetical protein